MKSIELTQGQVTWVDDWNFDWLSQWNWYAQWSENTQKYYAARKENRKMIWMHREIMNTPKDMKTDHINHDTLFNLESNLRICTNAENMRNRPINRNNVSGYKGVHLDKQTKKFRAQIMYNGVGIPLGRFSIITDAARAYDKKAKELFGEFAVLNFPLETS